MKSKKRIKVTDIELEIQEDGKAGLVFICEDGREVANMVPPTDFLDPDQSTALTLLELKERN